MLSHRAAKNTALQDLPWRFAPRGGNRYHAVDNPDGVVVFGTAEDALIHEELSAWIQDKVSDRINITFTFSPEMLTYRYSTVGGQRFPKAMAAHINQHFQPHVPISPSNVVTAASLTGVHEMLGFCLGDSGDGILTIPPVYGRFELDFGNTVGMKMLYGDMGDVDAFDNGEAIVARLKSALVDAASTGCVVRALLIVNPNNPVGRCYPASTLATLMAFCRDSGLHFISDEVYALSVYDADEQESVPFTSALAVHRDELLDHERVHVLYGMSKDFGSAGLRIGCLITHNALLRKAMSANARFHATSGPPLAMASEILEDQTFVEHIIGLSRQRLAHSRRIATERLKAAGIRWHRGGNAGFFLYLDLSPWLPSSSSTSTPEFDLAATLLQAGVGLHPGEEHYGKPGWFRLVFSCEMEILEEGLRRLTDALAKVAESRGGAGDEGKKALENGTH